MRSRQPHSTHVENPAPPTGARIRFVPVPTTPLVQVESLDGAAEPVKGALVKVAPTLKASERHAFDGAAVSASLRARGALAVQLAPRTVAEVVQEKVAARTARTSPEEAVEAYFAGLKGVPLDEAEEAKVLVLELLAQEQGAGGAA